jgi:heptosyltransferase-3
MGLNKKINALRRTAMSLLTSWIGTGNSLGDFADKAKISRVLISRPNHRLGNLLLMTPLVQEIIETFPNATIDLFVKGDLTPSVFQNYDQIGSIIQLPKKPFSDFPAYLKGWMQIKRNKYDVVINVVNGSSSGKVSAQLANAKYRFYGEIDSDFLLKYNDHEHLAKSPVYSFRNYLAKSGLVENGQKVPTLDLKLNAPELSEGKKLLQGIVQNDQKTICLFTNATGDKIYSSDWWDTFYQRLKIEFPDYNIIEILPVENISQIGFKAPTFFNRNIRITGSVIANTDIFIAADSGMMHLGASVHTPTVGLFKVTDPKAYEPYGNGSVAIDTNVTGLDASVDMVKSILSDATVDEN